MLLFEPVDHGVVWLTIGIESNLIVPSSAGFLTHELTHALGAQVGQARKGISSGEPEGGDVVSKGYLRAYVKGILVD